MSDRMTKGERSELASLIRKRERVLKAAATERSAAMMAEYDRQSAAIYAYDDDDVWKRATEIAAEAVKQANEAVAERCKELGIPPEFAPSLAFGWSGRGQNAVAARRAELRRMAKSRVDAIELEARTRIEKMSLDAQTEVVANGLQSDAAKAFLENMPTMDALMPSIDVVEIRALVDQRSKRWDIY